MSIRKVKMATAILILSNADKRGHSSDMLKKPQNLHSQKLRTVVGQKYHPGWYFWPRPVQSIEETQILGPLQNDYKNPYIRIWFFERAVYSNIWRGSCPNFEYTDIRFQLVQIQYNKSSAQPHNHTLTRPCKHSLHRIQYNKSSAQPHNHTMVHKLVSLHKRHFSKSPVTSGGRTYR